MNLFVEILTFTGLALVFYVYLGYPLIMALLARLKPCPVRAAERVNADLPRISLIICAYNEAPHVADKIRNTLALDYPPERLEILFSSDGSSDGSERIAQECGGGRVQILHEAVRQGKPAALNRGLAAATGEIVVFSDARPLYQSDALRRLAADFADPEVGMVSGVMLFTSQADDALNQSNNTYFSYEDWIRKNESASGSTVSVFGAMMAVRRELVQPFPPHIINDDSWLGLIVQNQGKRVVCDPEALATAPPPKKVAGDMERRYRISAGRFQLMLEKGLVRWRSADALWRFWSHKGCRALLPFFLLLAFVPGALACLLLQPVSSLLWLVILPQALWYAVSGLGWLAQQCGFRCRALELPWFITRGTFGALVGLHRFCRRTQKVTWKRSERAEK